VRRRARAHAGGSATTRSNGCDVATREMPCGVVRNKMLGNLNLTRHKT